jgi:hypothetical protein
MRRGIIATMLLTALLGCPLLGANPSWIQGTSGPATWTVTPGNPGTSDTITAKGPLDVASYGNSCVAEGALGGTPQITVDNANKAVDLWFQGPAPTMCTLIYMPVCGLQGTFGPLAAGRWTFRCITLGVNIDFMVGDGGIGGGSIIYVDRNSPGPIRDGTTWARSFLYVQDALAVSGTGNEIHVADGSYRPDQGGGQTAGNREATFNVQNGTIIKGGYAGYGAVNPNARDIDAYATILTGDLGGNDLWGILNRSDNSYHVVTISGDAKLDGLTIRSGQADGPYPHFYGGGIYAVAGHLIVSRCTLRGNTALYGGGMAALAASTYFGNCVIAGNRAYVFGGGIYNDDSSTTLATCLMTGNSGGTSGLGGGSAVSNMGGSAANVTLGNCTLSDNVGPYPDSIVVLNFSLTGAVTGVVINNSIIYNDGGSSPIWTNDTAKVTASYSIIQGGWTGTGNLDANPLFVQKGVWSIEGEWIDTSSDYSVQSTSPAIDGGSNSLLAADSADVDDDGNTSETHPTDLADQDRIQSTRVDMGAYENSGSGGSGGYAWVPLMSFDVTFNVPYGLTGPITVNSDLITVTPSSSFVSELKLEAVATSVAGGTWTAWFDPAITTVGPGTFTVSFRVRGTNVAAQLLTPGASNVQIALVTMYVRPAP